MNGTTNRPTPLPQILARTAFGPPADVSDELKAFSPHATIDSFMHSVESRRGYPWQGINETALTERTLAATLAGHYTTEGAIPLGPVIFAARRFPAAFESLWMASYYLCGELESRINKVSWASDVAKWDAIFRPSVGDAWLAWMLLLTQNGTYWFDTARHDGQGDSLHAILKSVLLDGQDFGEFDTAAPYFEAMLPLESIAPAIRAGISPDILSAVKTA